jgi:hypothetical protein
MRATCMARSPRPPPTSPSSASRSSSPSAGGSGAGDGADDAADVRRGREAAAAAAAAAAGAAATAGRQGDDDESRERLRRDAQSFRARATQLRAAAAESRGDHSADTSVGRGVLSAAKSAFDTLLVWNFFLVVILLGWLVVALVPHFAAKNDALLDPWLSLWQPFTQPVLGVLMLSTIVQGMWSFMFSK